MPVPPSVSELTAARQKVAELSDERDRAVLERKEAVSKHNSYLTSVLTGLRSDSAAQTAAVVASAADLARARDAGVQDAWRRVKAATGASTG